MANFERRRIGRTSLNVTVLGSALDHGDDEELWNGDEQDDHPEAWLGVEHITQYAEQRRINVHVRERSHTLVHAGNLMVEPAVGQVSSAGSLGIQISKAFETIYLARLTVFKLKFGLKFLISALQSTAVFVLLLAGGIMVLNGKTEIGIVVAFIGGLDRVLELWHEMIAFLRSTSAARVQFDLIESTLGKKL